MLKFQLPAYQEIPNVGLYLEQTLKYINDTFSVFRSVELTKSMISNYVKLGYLRRPIKKQYDREQIAALLFIAVSKQVLSMDNIGKLFRMQVELGSMEESYTAFKADFDYLLDSIWNQKVMDSGQVSAFMQPQGAYLAYEERKAEGQASQSKKEDRTQDGFPSSPVSPEEAYMLLWQVASADAYSIYLNELFSHMSETPPQKECPAH
ncbi:DUF1836 domain-containing protein [Porcincola intestinalis]|uniref:DUF1836 domain-containing protein n=1 Tax=Porcincola intestinalis TaxID=2606632 RepID=UPI0023F1DA0D|nr:DUF1836 domain-containing protein [Porcincola intestinalis]MCI6768031.1 DUF1836 domain-containing protein [Lachnospiraceae bacterium]MDD7060265.1 DUF1836 domain-containing protein [Porcincola intestinalis]MDY4205733.1 DUF1836 domain-containing protein [Porcincola intestinalis]MDY5284333.1 DUF1836 domain-containing protein [Porcincola intestinalis]